MFRRVSCCRISYEKFSVGEPTGPSNGFTDLGFAGWMQKGLGRMEIAGLEYRGLGLVNLESDRTQAILDSPPSRHSYAVCVCMCS